MSYNIYAGTDYVLDREETIKKVISNRPIWNSARKEMLQTACTGDIQEGDLLYFCNSGSVGEFVGFVYVGGNEPMVGIKFYEEFNSIKRGIIYQYFISSISGVFYKVPYFWIDNVPVYDGMAVYGKYNDHKYTVENGWLIPEDEYAYCQILITEKTDSTAYTLQPPKKEYWIAFCGEIALDKVDTLENVKEFVKQLGYDPRSESMKYVKVEV